MVFSGLMNTNNMILSKVLKEQEWPYFRMFGSSCLLISMGIFSGLLLSGSRMPDVREGKWVLLRGFFGVTTYFTAVIAVYEGTPMGDVAALTSVNMVVAAFLGRLLLGEALRSIHLFALVCSLVGAALISQPSFLFPHSGREDGRGWVGYVLAPASGTFQACVFICSRKSAGTSAWIHLLSTMAQCGLAGLLLPLLPVVSDHSLEPLGEKPLVTAGWLALILGAIFVTSLSTSVASRWCPAAVSATTTTAMRMSCSYAAQALLFGEALEPLTLLGAALMLAGVVAMAGARAAFPRSSQAEGSQQAPDVSPGDVVEGLRELVNEEAETESLASFIASEFADCSPHEKAVRFRRSAAASEPPAQQLGAVVAAVATVAL